VLAEFLGGVWFPGNALAMNFFKSYGYVTTAHTLNFAQDLKLAHYTHMAPWTTFTVQMVATFGGLPALSCYSTSAEAHLLT
jgi:hypothetical protein